MYLSGSAGAAGAVGQCNGVDADFCDSHLSGVAFLVKQDEVLDVIEIGLLGFATEMPEADGLAHAIKKFRRLRHFHDRTCAKRRRKGVLSRTCGITPIISELDRQCLTTLSRSELSCNCGLIYSCTAQFLVGAVPKRYLLVSKC